MRQKVKKLILDGVDANIAKTEKSKEMNKLMGSVAKSVGLTKQNVRQLKDIIHYKGMGWGKDALEIEPKKKGEPKRYTDRVTPVFKKLVTLIETCRDADELHLLKEYLEATHNHGIHINIDVAPTDVKCTDRAELDNALDELNEMQTIVCQKNDYITQDLAEQAENMAFAPKGKYKSVVELATKIKEGKDVDEKIEAILVKNNMHNGALETIVEEAERAPEVGMGEIEDHKDRVEKSLELVDLEGYGFVLDLNERTSEEVDLVTDTLKIVENSEECKQFLKDNNIEIYKEGQEYIAITSRIPIDLWNIIVSKKWHVNLK